MSLIEHWLTVREAYAIASDDVQDCARGAGDPGDVRSKLVPADQLQRAVEEHRAFVEGLTKALNEHGVPAMPSWREAIDYLARHGGQ